MSNQQRLSSMPNSPPGDRRRTPHRPSPGRRPRQSDVESPSYDSSTSPSRKTGRDPRTRALPSPGTPKTEQDAMMMPPQYPNMEPTRKRSLIRPERNRIDRDHPNYYYRQHAQNMETRPSTTGNDPLMEEMDEDMTTVVSDETDLKSTGATDSTFAGPPKRLRRKSEHNDVSDGMQRKMTRQETEIYEAAERKRQKQRQKELDAARPPSLWNAYCHLVTFWCPDAILRCFGKPSKPQQRAWREKMGLLSIILLVCTFVGYLTFGFTQTVCPNGGGVRLQVNHVDSGFLIIHGQAYDLSRSRHPYARGIPDGANVLYDLPQKHGGQDASFLFQNVNGNCKGLITAAPNSDVPTDVNGDLAWYFPCNLYNQDGSSKPNLKIPYYLGYACHLQNNARDAYYGLSSSGAVYFTWDDVKNSSRNLAVWGGDVVDLDLLLWFNKTQVSWPTEFDQIRENPDVRGTDLTLAFSTGKERQIAKCFTEIIKVGSIDTATIGCIASKVVLYVALAFILSIVIIKFLLALTFQWFLSRKFGAAKSSMSSNPKKRNKQIEDWSDDIYRAPPKVNDPALTQYSGSSRRSAAFLPTTSRFTSPYAVARSAAKRPAPTTMASQSTTSRLLPPNPGYSSDLAAPQYSRDSRSSLLLSEKTDQRYSAMADVDGPGPSGFIHDAVVPQPPPEWQPFGYPLAHAICLVTAYSEGEAGLRTTLDSIAITEYPNSHKIILIICDGTIKGKGEEFTTPDICLGMMKDHAILPDEVQAFSYVAVASGSKRHNMAKVYSGFYDYGEDSAVAPDRQQRVPMMVIVKCGTPDEATKSKPGNRGKRDSQVMLMGFLQKVMFDERMTELEFEMFNGIWKITGISPDFYEVVLMVDADTKVFPDCLTHMVSAMVKDPEIMGLCGETKIANKNVSWVTMIQVFEYFISHHLAKSFESVFGGVTCLPGCFSMYRIKAPKGGQNYWVPILANPDIVEHYSENVVDTLHKKNLLLLGEDRYLSTLMLKTFPKRKQVFVPQAVCKTVCPETFRVLLSQRRRWINSTIHNLMELVLVRDLCGTFCFSMQFVVFIELVGTLVLPAAISFTIYLIIISVKAGITHTEVPVIPLVLLALILGLPAVLIVLTAHRWSYVAWMLIYLLSLPIWNFVLPTYAYWKFDDFSWGDTRKLAGEKTKKAGLEYEGEFDSSKITMKRWGDFEQERRLRGPSAGWPQQPSTLSPSEQFYGRISYHDI